MIARYLEVGKPTPMCSVTYFLKIVKFERREKVMQELMIFEGHEVEVLEVKGQVLFNPYHVGACLDLADSSVRNYLAKMNEKQLVKVKNSDVRNEDIRKLNNAGESFLTESGVYKLVFKSRKPNAEAFTDWIADDVLPTLRKTGSYEIPESKAQGERLASVNNAVKILTPLLEKAGCNSKIQLLTAKQLYEKAQVFLPIDIQSDKRYWDTVHIARQAGIFYKSSGKPADKAVNEIIRRIGITEADYTDTWESKGKWQGTVRKYSDEVIERVRCWITDNDYPLDIEYQQTDGQVKSYHVAYKNQEVA